MRQGLLSAFALLSVATFVAPLHAGGGVWGSRGITASFVLRGDVLYAAEGRGVATYDVSDPRMIRRIDVEVRDEETTDVALFGPAEVVTATRGGVTWFAVGAGGALAPIGFTPTAEPLTRIAAGDRFVAGASGRDVLLFERSGAQLARTRTVRMNGDVMAMAFVGDSLLVSVSGRGTFLIASESGDVTHAFLPTATQFARAGDRLWGVEPANALFEVDVADPAHPEITAYHAVSEIQPTGVAASESRVYVVEPPDRVHVFDVSAAGEVARVATISEWASVIAGNGTHFFVAGSRLDGEGLPYETGAPVRAFDVRNAAAPALTGEYRTFAGPVSGVWTDGSIAYVVDAPYLRVLDVSDSDDPRQINAIEIPEIQERIRVKKGLAVLYGRGLVHIVDVTRPTSPRHVGTWHTQGHPPSAAAIADGRIIEANEHSGLHVLDYSDPENAVQIGGRMWHYHDLASGDDAIYALQRGGFLVLEIVGRATVEDRGGFNDQGEQLEIAPPNSAFPTHLLLRRHDGIVIYGLEADRFVPMEKARVAVDRPGVLGTGAGMAWVAWQGFLHRLDLDSPDALVPAGMPVTSPQQISVAGEKVVVADRYSVRVFGPDTPAPPPARRRSVRR